MNAAELVESLEKQAVKVNLTRKQLAIRLGISVNYIYRIKDGSRKPGPKFLRAIRRELPSLKELTYLYEDSLFSNSPSTAPAKR
jgi:transcriptional regulator with XRE-family HTH domain